MPLLERVSTLLRANLSDLLDKAEDPEKLAKQIILDLENQLLQVKTQVAFAIADQHRLLQQQREHEVAEAKWRQNAELAVGKGEDDLARAALEQSLSCSRSAAAFAQQHAEQTAETDTAHGLLEVAGEADRDSDACRGARGTTPQTPCGRGEASDGAHHFCCDSVCSASATAIRCDCTDDHSNGGKGSTCALLRRAAGGSLPVHETRGSGRGSSARAQGEAATSRILSALRG